MSTPPLTSQVLMGSSQNALESQHREDSVVISADPINVVAVNLAGSGGRPPLLSSIRKDEAIVTRRELWSYYRQSSFLSFLNYAASSRNFFQSILQRK